MIKRVTKEDRAVFCELMDEFYHTDAVLAPIPKEYMENTFDEAASSDTYLEAYLLRADCEYAGYAILSKSFSPEAGGKVVWIEELYIRPEHQGKGIGKQFFAFAEKIHGLKRLRLEVEHDNTRAIKLYQELGYEVLEYKQMFKEF